ncbi:unnamed protein product [Rotaria sp. Silwood1]|nr:unnamed protein product [Rotaria sp. Silwood1]
MNNEILSIERSNHRRSLRNNTQQHRNHLSKLFHMKNVRKLYMISTDFIKRYGSIRTFFAVLAFVIFTILSITIGVLTVYLTSPTEQNIKCRFIFKRSVSHSITYDSSPQHVAVGHFNNDSYLDFVVANSGSDSIGLFMGFENGSFDDQILFSTGFQSRPYYVAVDDFNNDSHADIVVANYGVNSIGVFLGYGNGNFTNQIITSLGSSHPIALAIGDFNKDNQLDLVVVNNGTSTIAILYGLTNGTFQIKTSYDMGYDSSPYSLAVADINDDKKLDIVVVNSGTSELAVLLASDNETFVIHKYSIGKDSYPFSVAIGNFNNDDYLDVAVANSGTSNVGIFLGYGNGSFMKIQTYSTGSDSYPDYVVVGYFNNKINLDIIVIDLINYRLIVLKGYGNGSFSIVRTRQIGVNSYPSSISVGDFDNDGDSDIAITVRDVNVVEVFTQYFNYPVLDETTYSTGKGSKPRFSTVGDFNNDGHLDVVVANYESNSIGLFINHGNGTFRNQEEYYVGEYSTPSFLVTGDFNKDQYLDIVLILYNNSKIAILLGYSNGNFSYKEIYSTDKNFYFHSIAVGDINNDGHLDVIAPDVKNGSFNIFIGYGNGTFKNIILILTIIDFYPYVIQCGDLNNDKILDIVASDSFGHGIAILFGDGNEFFQNQLITSTKGSHSSSITIGNLNSDNWLDIIYVDEFFAYVVILLNSGNGTFENVTQYLTVQGSQPHSVALGYLNDDNLLDIVIANTLDDSINIFFGNGNGNGKFRRRMRISTGFESRPKSTVIGDFNNDNKQDIVVANTGNDNIVIFLVHYEADFLNGTYYVTGTGLHPSSVAVGDLNNDGVSDIVAANLGTNTIEIFLDYNKENFISSSILQLNPYSLPQYVIVADFNEDSSLDIAVVTYYDHSLNVFLGLGNGSFGEKLVYLLPSESFPAAVASGNFNQDDRMDIVIGSDGTNDISVFLSFDYLTFSTHVIYTDYLNAVLNCIATGDLDNDHILDLVVCNSVANTIIVFLGYGNGSFLEKISYSTGKGSSPYFLVVDDFNNDKNLDILVTNRDTDSVGLFLGYGNGSFQSQISYPTGDLSWPISVATDDFNSDTLLDFVVANSGSNIIGVFFGNGDGTFQEQIKYRMINGTNPVWISVNDMNNDGILDIIVAYFRGDNVGILLGSEDGTFGNQIILPTGSNSGPISIAIADFNNNNGMDIAVANYFSKNIFIFFGYGNGTFSLETMIFETSYSSLVAIVAADINNDTVFDILIVDADEKNSSIGIFYGLGNGNFTLQTVYSTGFNSNQRMIVIGDYNNDGKLDLAIPYFNQNSIGIMLQHSVQPFGPYTTFTLDDNTHPFSVVVADFNDDHQQDIAVANFGTDNICILLGNGNGNFADQMTYSTGTQSGPSSISVGDFNNDHHFDIVVTNFRANNVLILLGYGNGAFLCVTNYSTGISSSPFSVAVADLNKDNHLDLVVANWGTNNIIVLYGLDNATFTNLTFYSLGYNASPRSVAIGDINNDNLLDIVVANDGTNYVEILLQTC